MFKALPHALSTTRHDNVDYLPYLPPAHARLSTNVPGVYMVLQVGPGGQQDSKYRMVLRDSARCPCGLSAGRPDQRGDSAAAEALEFFSKDWLQGTGLLKFEAGLLGQSNIRGLVLGEGHIHRIFITVFFIEEIE